MDRMSLKVGDKVVFGRKRGEKTRATVLKLNFKKAKVRQDEDRGRGGHRVGDPWTVSYALIGKDPTGGIPEAEVRAAIAEAKTGVAIANAEGEEEPTPKAEGDIIGSAIVSIRHMTAVELSREGWVTNAYDPGAAIVLSSGAVLYASQDSEGNGPGALFGCRKGKTFVLAP